MSFPLKVIGKKG